MATALQRVRLDTAYLGMDVDSAPGAVARAKGTLVQNYLTGAQGRLRQRGGITATALSIAVTNGRLGGMFRGKDKLLLGYRDGNSTTRIVEPWVAPYKQSALADLARALDGANDGKLVTLAPTPGVVDHDYTTRGLVPGPNHTNFGKFSYAIAYDSVGDTGGTDDIANQRGGIERRRRILRWNTDAGGQPVSYAFMPGAAQDLKLHYGKLLVLGGTLDFATYTDHHALFYSNPLVTDDYTNGINNADANWNMWNAPPAYTVPNRIALPGDTLDFGVKMARAGRHLAVLQRHSVLLLTGYDAASWQIRTFAEGVGCLDPRSVVEAADGCFFLSEQGFMFFDGVQLKDASEGMHRAIVDAALAMVGDEGASADGGFAVADRLTNEYLMLTIGKMPFAVGPPTPTVSFCGIYHVPTNSWSTFLSASFATTNTAPTHVGRTENRQWLADHSNLYIAGNLTTPEIIATGARGKDGSANIATKWHSRTSELAAPFQVAHLKRILVDYEWRVNGAAADAPTTFDPAGATNRPLVTVMDGDGTTIGTFRLPRGAGTPPNLARQRFSYELFGEANDIQVRIEYTDAATFLDYCAILDVFIEFQPGQERHP